GKALAKRAKTFRDEIESVNLQTAQTDQPVSIKITSLEFLLTHYLAPYLGEGIACYPETLIELVGTDRRVSLAYGEADLALRFGRPQEGQLIASKILDMDFALWNIPDAANDTWIGLPEDLDWTPEMQLGLEHFQKPPAVRVTSFAAGRRASFSLGLPFIAPGALIRPTDPFQKIAPAATISREVWSVIHETRRLDQRLAAVRQWAKNSVLKADQCKYLLDD
ncbi:MAG: hypothetical protein AAF701_05930, partial [Pseudomonadota bacterium]